MDAPTVTPPRRAKIPKLAEDGNGFVTPPSASNEHQVLGSECITPQPSGVKRLMQLKEECKSPALRVPASPMMKRLGYGTGVGVYLMERSPKASGEIRSPWAIKKIAKIKESKSIYSDRIEYEATILKQLNHPNIVGYRGFSKPTPDNSILAMEKASTSLSDLIEEKMDISMDAGNNIHTPFLAKHIQRVALNIANALDYLHEEMKFIHGDLKSANVLIFGDFEIAKLCDFGVARKVKDDGTIEGNYVGTEIWNPMEVILSSRGVLKYPVTTKADIYPFGLTIYEMLALKPPHLPTDDDDGTGTLSDSEGEQTFDENAFEDMLAEAVGTRPLLPDLEFDESYNKVLETFYCCTEEDPGKRPTAEDIITLLCLMDTVHLEDIQP